MKKKRKRVCTVVISDVHIFSELCQAELLIKTLRGLSFKRLIIVGDLVEDDQVPPTPQQMPKAHWQLIKHLKKRQKKGVKIVRVGGNHDWSGMDFINNVLGVETLKEYRWRQNDKLFCAIHGHQWDRFVSKNVVISKIVTWLFLTAQRFDTRRRFFTRLLNRLHLRWFRLTETVATGAIKYAHKKGIDVIICGHTHEQVINRVSQVQGHTVQYYNCGDWTGYTCSFLTIDGTGNIEGFVLEA